MVHAWEVLTFSAVGGFNPDGDDPLPLTQDTPLDTVLVSIVDSKIINELGPDTAFPRNIFLRENFTMTQNDGERDQLPAVTEVKGYEQGKSLPYEAITGGVAGSYRGSYIYVL